MFWLIFIGIIFGCFGLVILFGAPFLPTLKEQIPVTFELLNLKPGQTLLELGSGDGRLLAYAAEQGLYAVGYELNPLLATYSWLRTRKYGKKVKIIWGNYWISDWPKVDGIFVFLLQKYMSKLDKKIVEQLNLWDPNSTHVDGLQGSNEERTKRTGSTLSEQRKQLTQQSAASTAGVSSLASQQGSAMRGVRLVSFAFQIKTKKPAKIKQGLYLYEYK